MDFSNRAMKNWTIHFQHWENMRLSLRTTFSANDRLWSPCVLFEPATLLQSNLPGKICQFTPFIDVLPRKCVDSPMTVRGPPPRDCLNCSTAAFVGSSTSLKALATPPASSKASATTTFCLEMTGGNIEARKGMGKIKQQKRTSHHQVESS